MSRRGRLTLSNDRGVSNQIAVILLIGLVVSGATVVLLLGGQMVNDLKKGVKEESGEKALREFDSEISSLSFEDNANSKLLDFGTRDSGEVWIDDSGYVNISMNRRPSCTANVSISSIRYRSQSGDVYGYEMGGLWLGVENGSVMRSPPTLRYEQGTLTLTAFNFTGNMSSSTSRIRKLITRSQNRTETVSETIYSGECQRPNNVTVTIKSDFYEAWHEYVAGEVNATSLSVYDANETVRLFLGQERLPASTDDSRNEVVNLNGAAYVNVTAQNNSISVSKNASVSYTVNMRPLAKGTQVSSIESFESDTIYRPPIDVSFVVDESGSMQWNGPDGDPKYESVRDAMGTFVGILNGSRDRVGVVGFDTGSRYLNLVNSPATRYLMGDFDNVNDTIDNNVYSGGTNTAAGMQKANVLMDLKSNGTHKKVVVLLSDGQNDHTWMNTETEEWAERANDNGAVVYTIAFGTGPNEAFLKSVAEKGGGTYYFAQNSSELNEVFRNIANEVTETRTIAEPAISLEMNTAGQSFYPQVSGDTSHIASDTSPGGDEILNVNDPSAPSQFSFTFTMDDGDNVSMNARSYSCSNWVRSRKTVTNETTNETYTVVRCADLDESSVQTIPPSKVEIYRDGDSVTSLLAEEGAWWQPDLRNDTLLPYLDNGTDTLALASNQAIVVFDYNATDGGAKNRLIALLEIGQSEASAGSRNVVKFSVNHFEVEPA